MTVTQRWVLTRNVLLVATLILASLATAAVPAERADANRNVQGADQGSLVTSPMPAGDRNNAWLTTPDWEILLSDFGYSNDLQAHSPHWQRAYPWLWAWFWDSMLSGEWAAAIYYDQIVSPPIVQGPNAGQPETVWLEPNFLAPNWITNSNFWVVNPVQSWNRGHLPLPYLDTAFSTITNGQVLIDIDSRIVDAQMAMGRCTSWPFGWSSYIWSDRYVLHMTYTITNVSGQVLTNVEFAQFLHGHPGTHDEGGFMGDWEVYDPVRKFLPQDAWDHFCFDNTQWGWQVLDTWPWPWPYWDSWAECFISFSSWVPPGSLRSPSPWGLGDYTGHGGKPPRPGVHWDVEEHNLNPQGPPCTLYPPAYPFWGAQVAGAENWYLDASFDPGEQLVHEVVLGVAARAHGGWHWANDWWYWKGVDWPYPIPEFGWVDHPFGWPYYYRQIVYPYWWTGYDYPRPPAPIWFGFAWPVGAKAEGAGIAKVTARSLGDDGFKVSRDFEPDPAVTADLQQNWPWPDCEWYGFSLDGFSLPDSTFEVEVMIEGLYEGDVTYWGHAMIGDPEFGWSPDHYDSTIVEIVHSTAAPSPPATDLVLAPSRPNPFNPATTIAYILPAPSRVTLAVYDLAGRLVATLVDASQPPGRHAVTWDGRDRRGLQVGAGVYVARLNACGQALSTQLTLVK